MNIGIRLHDTIPGTLPERLAFIKKQGFSCAHVALSKVLGDFTMPDAPARLTPSFASEIREAFQSVGIEIAVLGCYLNLADPDAESRQRTQEIYRAHLRFAPMIGAGVVGTETPANPNSRFVTPFPEDEGAFRFFIDAVKPVVRAAEEAGAILAIEPVKTHIISTPERAERMLSELNSDAVQIILDAVNLLIPENAPQAQAIIQDAISRLGDRVRILHMKDYRLEEGKIHSIACGTGVMEYEKLLAFARKQGIPMTLEDTTPSNAEAARLYLESL